MERREGEWSMEERDLDMEMLKSVIQYLSKEIYDTMISDSGYRVASSADDIRQSILMMSRAIELLGALYENNTCLCTKPDELD